MEEMQLSRRKKAENGEHSPLLERQHLKGEAKFMCYSGLVKDDNVREHVVVVVVVCLREESLIIETISEARRRADRWTKGQRLR